MFARHSLIIDLDGLRPDVFQTAVETGYAPNIARLLGGEFFDRGLQIAATSPAPSATFSAQASLVTGAHPREHGIPGNQYLDRFGLFEKGSPRRLGFDAGDINAFDDALRVFTSGLAARRLQKSTLFERLEQRGMRSVVAGHMYATGAETWIKPSYWRMGLMTKGRAPLYVPAHENDGYIVRKLIEYVQQEGVPDVSLLYLMGIDHISHEYGPAAQMAYLISHVDPWIGQLADVYESLAPDPADLFVVFVSDHGQTDVTNDKSYALRIGSPGGLEMTTLFHKLGRRAYRSPLDRLSQCDTFIASNGGLCGIYVKRRGGEWSSTPDFVGDTLSLAEAFWDGHHWGTYGDKWRGSLAGVLVRNIAEDGWDAPYRVLTEDGAIVSLRAWFDEQPAGLYLDPVNRLANLTGPLAPDIMLLSDHRAGYYFGDPHAGVHGGLSYAESLATLAFGWPGATGDQWRRARSIIQEAVATRCRMEGNRMPSVVDMTTALEALIALHSQPESGR